MFRAALLLAVAALAAAVPTQASGAGRGPIPHALRTAESAAEDTIDLAVAGKREQAVKTARRLKATADGPAAAALRAAGVSAARIAEFRARAGRVAQLAPQADLLTVALAANRAFGLLPGFFALYDSAVPAAVTALDHFDFEAKLRAKAGDGGALRAAVARLDATWRGLRADVVHHGGARVASRFDAHVARMQRLATRRPRAQAVREAQHGLDLVDELEATYGA